MGNTCCNYAPKDAHVLEETANNVNGKPIKMDPKISEETMAMLKK